jgi:hypothetical protein
MSRRLFEPCWIVVQYDNDSDNLGINSRIRWTVRPGTDVFPV